MMESYDYCVKHFKFPFFVTVFESIFFWFLSLHFCFFQNQSVGFYFTMFLFAVSYCSADISLSCLADS